MQPRRPPAPALLLTLWLLLSLALRAAAREHPDVPARPPAAMGLPRGILQLAARTALHFFNFRAGSPSALRVLAGVQEGRAWVSGPRRGGTRAGTAALPPRDRAAPGAQSPQTLPPPFRYFRGQKYLACEGIMIGTFGETEKRVPRQPVVGVPSMGCCWDEHRVPNQPMA